MCPILQIEASRFSRKYFDMDEFHEWIALRQEEKKDKNIIQI